MDLQFLGNSFVYGPEEQEELPMPMAPAELSDYRPVEEVQRGEERANGEHASYDPNRRIITLTGKASLGSGTNRIGGESVVVYLAERRAEVKGGGQAAGEGGRVRAVIDPKSLDLLKEPAAK